jgi:hypothetical protein
MPSTSARQKRFMQLCYGSPDKARGKCPPRSVAQEFARADARQAHSNKERMRKR